MNLLNLFDKFYSTLYGIGTNKKQKANQIKLN